MSNDTQALPVWMNSAKLRARWGGMSHTTLYRKAKAGLIPAPEYPFGPATPYWRTSEIEAFEGRSHKQLEAA